MEAKQKPITFPLSIQLGQVFESFDEVFERIEEEKRQLKLSQSMPFEIRFEPRKENFRYACLRCKYCKAGVNFKSNDQKKIVVSKVDPNHLHSPGQDEVQRRIYAMYKKRVTNIKISHLRDEIRKQFSLSRPTATKLLRKFQNFDLYGFEQLERWLQKNNYMYRCDWQNEPRDRHPRSMVLISPGMRQSYLRFGDLVAFDITYGLLRNVAHDSRSYKVGVFTVNDTNLRMLFAGIAIFVDETKQALFTVFDNFIQLHGKAPASFISDDQDSVAAAINELSANQFFNGAHMLDPWHLLKAMKRKIPGRIQEARLKEIMQLIVQRNIDDYRRDKEILKANPSIKSQIEEMETRKQRIFFCEVEDSFIGIRRNNCEGINELIKRDFPQEVRIDQFVEKIHILQQGLIYRSTHEFILMKEQMEKILCDDRIEEIRLHYEKKVMERFVENYIKGLRDFKITEKGVDAETGRPTFVLQFVDSSTSYSIQNWNCSCNELEKTGVACPHLILAATTTRGKSYDELISRRWKKEPVQLEEAPPKYVLRRSSEMAKGRRAVGRK